jgi:hypothetical protein
MTVEQLVRALADLEYAERRQVLGRADRLAATHWEDDDPDLPPHWSKELL